MSDFSGVDFFNDAETASEKTVAPKGVHEAKINSVENHTTQAGDKALKVIFELAGGQYYDQTEYYNLWHSREEAKQVSNKIFSQLILATGLDDYPDKKEELVGKLLRVVIGTRKVDQPDGSVKEYTNVKGYLASENANVGSGQAVSPAVGVKPSLGS